MLTQTPAALDHWRRSDDHDALQALIAEGLATDSSDPGKPRLVTRRKDTGMDLLQRSRATRYPTRVPLGPQICRVCHLQRTRQERQCDDLLSGQCKNCHDPSL